MVRALVHAAVSDVDKTQLRNMRVSADPVLLLAAMRAAQAELGVTPRRQSTWPGSRQA